MSGLREKFPFIVAPLVGAGLYCANRFSMLVPSGKIMVWWGIGVITVAAVAAAGFLMTRPTAQPAEEPPPGGADGQVEPGAAAAQPPMEEAMTASKSLRLTEPPILLTTGAFLFLLIAESSLGRWALVGLSMLLIAVYFEGLRRAADRDNPVAPADLAQLAHVLDLTAVFLMMTFIFGIRSFYAVPMPAMAAAVAVIWAFVASENLTRAGYPIKISFRQCIASGVFGAEAYVALTFLPISHLVDAAVAVLLLAVSIQLFKLTLAGAAASVRVRREMAAAVGMAALLLLTARWI